MDGTAGGEKTADELEEEIERRSAVGKSGEREK